MNKALPAESEPSLPRSGEGNTLRRLCYATLILLVATGGWVRFSDRIAEIAPALAAPGSAAPQSGRVRGLLELGLAPAAASAAAVQAMGLPAQDQNSLLQALDRRQVRMFQLPVFERDGGTGAAVQVSSGGLTRVVHLSADPIVLTLPISHVGTVSFRMVGSTPQGSLGIGALTLTGPVMLQSIAAGDVLQVGVVAQ